MIWHLTGIFIGLGQVGDAEINDPVWEDWPENISQRDDLHYVDPETTAVLGPVIARAPLEASSPSQINTPRPISPYQLDVVPEANIRQITPCDESETATSPLSSLSTPISVRSRLIRPEQDTSHAD